MESSKEILFYCLKSLKHTHTTLTKSFPHHQYQHLSLCLSHLC